MGDDLVMTAEQVWLMPCQLETQRANTFFSI